MADKEKIKEEIERLKTQNETYLDKEYAESTKWYKIGAYDACNAILSFINSIPEESVSKDLESQYKSNMRYQHTYTQDDLMKTKNEDLEEYYKKEFLPKELFAKPGQRTISQFNFFTARHFAEWQKQKDFQDFMEKAEEFFKSELYVSVSDQICSMNEFKTKKDFVNYFKNHMKK